MRTFDQSSKAKRSTLGKEGNSTKDPAAKKGSENKDDPQTPAAPEPSEENVQAARDNLKNRFGKGKAKTMKGEGEKEKEKEKPSPKKGKADTVWGFSDKVRKKDLDRLDKSQDKNA